MATVDESRGLLKYTSRDYNSILEDFWKLVPTLTDLWTPEADADPGVVLGKYLASIADMLGVNTDMLANEVFAPTVTQRKDADKLFGLIGYKLGWYTAGRTEVTFTNNSAADSGTSVSLNFGYSGESFATLNAYSDITGEARTITYNILPLTNKMGSTDSRAIRKTTTDSIDVFATTDPVVLKPGESVTRVAIEGDLRSVTLSVEEIKQNNYLIQLPSQHVDTTAVWIKARSSLNSSFLTTQWKQVESTVEFVEPEPRFAVVYDNYGNAQVQISNYLNDLENYSDNYLTVFWIDCSGAIGCVGADTLSDYTQAVTMSDGSVPDLTAIGITNLANTVELPHTYAVSGKSPETAKEAYINSRNQINTWNSLITLPDFTRFLNREPGVDCGVVLDCQKVYEINRAIYENEDLTEAQKIKMYITSADFPLSDHPMSDTAWSETLKTQFNLDSKALQYFPQFKQYAAVCFAVHNNFEDSNFGRTQYSSDSDTTKVQYKDGVGSYKQYKPPAMYCAKVVDDYRPLQAMTVELTFGWARIFPWFVVGQIYPVNPVSTDTATTIINNVKEALRLYFAPENRKFGQKPTVMEVVTVIQSADSRIRYFDAGSLSNPVINWGYTSWRNGKVVFTKVDTDAFNPISFARYQDVESDGTSATANIRIAPEYLIKD